MYPRTLRPRHIEILKLAAQGYTRREVGEKLFLARSTINAHLDTAFDILEAKNMPHAVALSYELGYIKPKSTNGKE